MNIVHDHLRSLNPHPHPPCYNVCTSTSSTHTCLVCLQLSRGIFALVTPVVGVSYETLISYSNTFHLPFLYAGNPLTKQTTSIVKRKQTTTSTTRQPNPSANQPRSANQINADLIADYGLYLQPDIVHAIYKTMLYLKWDHFVYLYDNEEGNHKL